MDTEMEDLTPKTKGIDLAFRNVTVARNSKVILSGISGHARPGELLAIMGPSGAGKTTLLNTLAGRVPMASGEIILGGQLLNKRLKRKIAYVLQQDIFFSNLTLRETLTFVAMIRLPDYVFKEEKMKRLQEIVDTLDLNKCLDTNIGDMWMPGLSGGEKKRASIACELIHDPVIIFLDEPTTGLDSSTTSSLISTLSAYAEKSHKTIVCSIHQPSSQLFFQFHKLLLLSQGQVAYFGETTKVIDHFASLGIPIEEHYNPADFIMEKLKEDEDARVKAVSAMKALQEKYSIAGNMLLSASAEADVPENPSRISTKIRGAVYKIIRKPPASSSNVEVDANITDTGSVHMSLLDLEKPTNDDNKKWPTGFVTQYTQLTIRTFRESQKRILEKMKILENLLICAIVCLIYFQLPRNEETLRDRMGAVFFISAHWGFIPLFDAVTSFPMERVVINKERSAGWYRLSAYYCAKMTSELLLIIIQPTVFVVIAYWVIGLNGIAAFFATLGTVFIDSIAGQSFGLFVGIACMEVSEAMTVSIMLQMGIMLLGGLFTRSLPFWLDWLKYVSFLHYSFHSLMFLEFHEAPPVQCASNRNSSVFLSCREPNITSHTIPSKEVLQYYNVTWNYWQYILPLLFFTIIFRTLGYIVLRFFRKPV
ncbi:hypothetical protein ACJMK2_019487 [Sinanodonta woodiana]|uniref:ABC transporter domain-containing protein n=1 Tax=Sinanodonta woodiana TaxID=1069815 RepID=A0ABD3TWC2_SINWO